MRIADNESELGDYVSSAVRVSNRRPVLVEGYLRDAIECDVDAIADGVRVRIAGVLEHVEPAGISLRGQQLHLSALFPAGARGRGNRAGRRS